MNQDQAKPSFNEEESNPGEVLIQTNNESGQFSQDNSKLKKTNINWILGLILIVAASATVFAVFLNKPNKREKVELKSLYRDGWKPAGDRIKTKWGKNLDYKKVWQEYPRPQLQREDWMNLNGLWNYAIRDQSVLNETKFDGQILVPFPLESSLSGVMKNLLRPK